MISTVINSCPRSGTYVTQFAGSTVSRPQLGMYVSAESKHFVLSLICGVLEKISLAPAAKQDMRFYGALLNSRHQLQCALAAIKEAVSIKKWPVVSYDYSDNSLTTLQRHALDELWHLYAVTDGNNIPRPAQTHILRAYDALYRHLKCPAW